MDTFLTGRLKLCIRFAFAVWLTVICAAPKNAGVLLPPADVNTLVMLETQAQDMALLGLIIGPNQDPLAWTAASTTVVGHGAPMARTMVRPCR